MLNPQNLVPNEARTPEERRKNAQKAGRASGKARRQKKEFRTVLEELLSLPSAELDNLTNIEALCVAMMKKAQSGNVYAAMFIRDTIGQKPTDKISQTGSMTIGWDVGQIIMEARERADKMRVNPPAPIEPDKTPGTLKRQTPAKPDNRITYAEPPKTRQKKKPLPFLEYEEPETNCPPGMSERARRLQQLAQQMDNLEQSKFGAGYKSWGEE